MVWHVMELQLRAVSDVKVAPPESTTPADLSGEWSRVRARLQSEVGEVEYRTWLRQMTLGGCDGDEVTVLLPTRFLRDWVRSHYGDRITALWQSENSRVRRVDIRVGRAPEGLTTPMSPPIASVAATASSGADTGIIAEPADLTATDDGLDGRGDGVGLDPRFTFETFVVGKPNEFAYACARRVAEQPGHRRASTRCSCMAASASARRI